MQLLGAYRQPIHHRPDALARTSPNRLMPAYSREREGWCAAEPVALYGDSDTVSGVDTSRNLDLLRRAGQRAKRLERELADARAVLVERVKVAHGEGWSWAVMQKAGCMSPNTLQQNLRRAGILEVKKP